MIRILLLLTALVAGASSYVYTCNELKKFLATGKMFAGENKACVVIPATASLTEEPYASYIDSMYLFESDSGMKYAFKDVETDGSFCERGVGPWFIENDAGADIECSSEKYNYAEIMLIFTSDEPHIVVASTTPQTAKYGKGTHVFVATDGSLLIEKVSIDDGKETTLQFYSGAGKDEREERFALMPEKFVVGESTVIIGPVTTLVIEDDITVTLTITSFEEKQFISAKPGFSFTLMSSGRANDLQSSRPGILVSTNYGINDDTIAYDSLSITGTVKMDDDVNTALSIECYKRDVGEVASDNITATRDVIINDDCTSLDITYQGNLAPEDIYRSNEVIYLKIDSNADPVLTQSSSAKPPSDHTGATDPPKPTGKQSTTTALPSDNTDATDPPKPTGPVTTRRTPAPTTTTTSTVSPPSTASRLPSSTTMKTVQTTTSASGISIVPALFFVTSLRLF